MSNIVLDSGTQIVAMDSTGSKGVPSDARGMVDYYEDIKGLPMPYVNMKVIVNKDSLDNSHQKGEYVVTKLTELGDVDETGIIPIKDYIPETDPTVPAHVKAITQQNITDWNGKQDAISSTNTLSPSNIKDTNMNGKIAAYNNSGVLGSSGIDTTNVAVKSEMSIADGTGADAGTATIQLKSGISKKVLTQHQSLDGKVDKVTGKGLSTNDYDNTEKRKVDNAIQPLDGATKDNFVAFDDDGNIKDSGCNESTFIKGVKQNGTSLTPENGVVNITMLSAYEQWLDENGYDASQHGADEFLEWLKAHISKFIFEDYDATAAGDISDIGDAVTSTTDGAIGNITPSASTKDVILLMPNAASSATATMMFATIETSTQGVYKFVYVGSMNDLDASTFVEKSQIVNDFSGGANKVLSAEAGADINNYLKHLSQIFAIENDSQINATPITLSNRGQYVSKTGDKITTGTQYWRQSQPIAVSKGQVVVVYGASTGDGTIIALTDAEETFYTPVIIANDTIKPHFYKAVENGYVVVQCYYLMFHSAFIINDSPRINDILEKIATLNETSYEDRVNLGSLLFDYKLKINEWVFEYGNIGYEGANDGDGLTYFMRTRDFLSTENVGLIKVPQGLKFNRVCYYDSNKNYVAQEGNLNDEYEVKTTYPYFRFAIINVSGTAKINLGQTIQDKIDKVESQIGAIANVDTFTFDIVGTQGGYDSKAVSYNFVNGEMYHVSIETLDNRYETYLSVRNAANESPMNSIIRGKGKRDGYFTCNVDGGLKLAMTVANPYGTSSYTVKISKVIKSVYDRFNQIEPICSPSYALAEKQRVYNELIDRVNTNAAVFAFNTDQHLSYRNNDDTKLGKRWVLEGAKMLDELAYELPIDLVVLGGDSAGYYDNQVPIILKGINELTNTFQRCKCLVGIPGNHEAFQNNGDITPKAMYNTYGKINSFNPKFVSSNNTDACVCNGYIDDTYHKIRYIFIDIYSGYTNESGNETYRVNICRTYLEQTLNSMSNEYNAIIMSHRPLTTEFSGIVKMEDTKPTDPQLPTPVMIDAFSYPAELQDVLYNHKEQIIACICGHSHADVYAYSQTSGILYIETTCALPDSNYLFDNIPFNRKLSTNNYAPSYPWLTAYDIFVVNQEEKTIEALRYGQGTNRKWRYKSDGTNPAGFISYKNCVNGYIMSGTTPVTTAVVFTNTEDGTDVVSVTPNSKGFFETYLTLNATYNITCSGFTLDVSSVTMNGNKSLNIKATSTT